MGPPYPFSRSGPWRAVSVVITGYALTLCMDPTLLGATVAPDFFKDAIRCKAVICCRITPKQKVWLASAAES